MMVSVIIPLYNKAPYIQRTIDSVLAQTHADFEVIVVDYGSTDGSGEIVRRYSDPRLRLIVQENAGVSCQKSRHRGGKELLDRFSRRRRRVAADISEARWRPPIVLTKQ